MSKRGPSPVEVASAAAKSAEQQVRAAVDALRTAAAETEAFAISGMLDDVRQRFEVMNADALTTVDDLRKKAQMSLDRSLDTYAERLHRQLTESGLKVHGQPPYIVAEGRIFLNFDRAKATLTLNLELVQDLRVQQVSQAVHVRLQALSKSAIAPPDFAAKLSTAYDRVAAEIGKTSGDQVRVDAVHRALVLNGQSKAFHTTYRASAYREYTDEMFRSDLYGLLSSGAKAPDGRTFQVDSGADTAGALWMFVPSLGRAAFAGRLRLVASDE